MTCTRISGPGFNGILLHSHGFRPGDQAPEGYLAWHDWADVQYKAGLRQKECGRCGKWRFPQELSKLTDRHEAKSRKEPVTVETAVCLKCAPSNVERNRPGGGFMPEGPVHGSVGPQRTE